TPAQLEKLGLSAKDADAIQTAYRHSNELFGNQMKQICADGKFGDDIGSCIGKLFQNVYANGLDSARPVFTQASEIRPANRAAKTGQLPPEVRMLLAFSGGMQPFEAELAQTFGGEEAHRLAYSQDLCFQANSM